MGGFETSIGARDHWNNRRISDNLAEANAVIDVLASSLDDVMDWINAWNPIFEEDDNWTGDAKPKAISALSAAKAYREGGK